MLIKSLTLARQAISCLYLDSFDPARRRSAMHSRAAIRDHFFEGHAQLPGASLREFCGQASVEAPPSIMLPSFCAEQAGVGSPAYFAALADICAAVQPRVVIETGTYLGMSALVFALNTPNDARITTFDLPDGFTELDNLTTPDQALVRARGDKTGHYYRNSPLAHKIHGVRGDSRQLKFKDYADSADLILIDGGHDRSCIEADTRNALSVIRKNGVILWDDYFWLYPDVVQFLNERRQDLKLIRLRGTYLVGYIHTGP